LVNENAMLIITLNPPWRCQRLFKTQLLLSLC